MLYQSERLTSQREETWTLLPLSSMGTVETNTAIGVLFSLLGLVILLVFIRFCRCLKKNLAHQESFDVENPPKHLNIQLALLQATTASFQPALVIWLWSSRDCAQSNALSFYRWLEAIKARSRQRSTTITAIVLRVISLTWALLLHIATALVLNVEAFHNKTLLKKLKILPSEIPSEYRTAKERLFVLERCQ